MFPVFTKHLQCQKRPSANSDIRGTFFLSQDLPQQFILPLPIGRIPQGHVHLRALPEHAALVGEGVKGLLAVVAAHARVPYPAERLVLAGQVEDGVIDAAAAEGAAVQNLLHDCLVLGEQVQRQGSLVGSDVLDALLQIIVGKQRQDGPENLLLHDRCVKGQLIDDGGGDETPVIVALAA